MGLPAPMFYVGLCCLFALLAQISDGRTVCGQPGGCRRTGLLYGPLTCGMVVEIDRLAIWVGCVCGTGEGLNGGRCKNAGCSCTPLQREDIWEYELIQSHNPEEAGPKRPPMSRVWVGHRTSPDRPFEDVVFREGARKGEGKGKGRETRAEESNRPVVAPGLSLICLRSPVR
jgi:hypothetical protein